MCCCGRLSLQPTPWNGRQQQSEMGLAEKLRRPLCQLRQNFSKPKNGKITKIITSTSMRLACWQTRGKHCWNGQQIESCTSLFRDTTLGDLAQRTGAKDWSGHGFTDEQGVSTILEDDEAYGVWHLTWQWKWTSLHALHWITLRRDGHTTHAVNLHQ